MTSEKLTVAQAIMKFFGMQPKDTLKEMKDLSHEERAELAVLCAKELGAEIVAE